MPKADIQVLVCGDDVRVLVNGHLIDVQLLRLSIEKGRTPKAVIEVDVTEVVITDLKVEIGD